MQGLNKVKKWSSLLIMVLVLGCCINSSAASSLSKSINGEKEVKTNYTMLSVTPNKLKCTVKSDSKYPILATVNGKKDVAGPMQQITSRLFSGSSTVSFTGSCNYYQLKLSGWKKFNKVKGAKGSATVY